jgi:hypothetical protein
MSVTLGSEMNDFFFAILASLDHHLFAGASASAW